MFALYFGSGSGWSYSISNCSFIYWSTANQNWIYPVAVQVGISTQTSGNCLTPSVDATEPEESA
jgi:hypothetical protein